jgi:hypothetical protein
MTPLDRKELDALIKIFARQMHSKNASADVRVRARAAFHALDMLRDRLTSLATKRKKFRLVAGGRL